MVFKLFALLGLWVTFVILSLQCFVVYDTSGFDFCFVCSFVMWVDFGAL